MSLILIELYKRWKTNDVREARVQTLRWALNEELRHGWNGVMAGVATLLKMKRRVLHQGRRPSEV